MKKGIHGGDGFLADTTQDDIIVVGEGLSVLSGFSSLFFYARNLGYGVRLFGLRAYVGTCVSVVG